jgi:hypothetical protein
MGELGENRAKHTLGGLLRFLNRRATGATTSLGGPLKAEGGVVRNATKET